MPGEKALLQEFTEKLNPPVLGQLLEVIFDKMQLAGEAGTLLKIEEEMQISIQKAREQWLKESGSQTMGDMFPSELDAATPQKKLGFDLRGIDNETFWDAAEQHILQALSDYADQAESSADQKRLFAEDATKGFAFIELCRKRFDVVLMNPPFGALPNKANEYARLLYPLGYVDFYTAFIDRGLSIINSCGYLGALTSRTNFVLYSFKKWREERFLLSKKLTQVLDLGADVLDNALVETAAYTISKNPKIKSTSIIDIRNEKQKKTHLDLSIADQTKQIIIDHNIFNKLPNSTITYTDIDDFSKGGEYALFYASIHLLVDWRNEGGYLGDFLYNKRPRNGYLWGPKSWTFNTMGSPGLFWSRKSQKGISFRVLPKDCASSDKTCYLITDDHSDRLAILSALNSKYFSKLVRSFSTGYGSYEKGTVGKVPLPLTKNKQLEELATICYHSVRNIYSLFETDIFYRSIISFFCSDFDTGIKSIEEYITKSINTYKSAPGQILETQPERWRTAYRSPTVEAVPT